MKHQIAAGNNNTAGLEFFHRLDPCLFQIYRTYIQQEWHDYEARELGADRRYAKVGLPFVVFIFPILTEEEYNYLITTYASNRIDGLVTIKAYDRSALTWKTFNATMYLPEQIAFDEEYGMYRDVQIEFRELVELV